MENKKCPKCKKDKSVSEFYKNKTRLDGLSEWCKTCLNEYCRKYYYINKKKLNERRRKWRENNPERVKIYDRKRVLKKVGLTIEQYNELFEDQKGCCAICGKHRSELNTILVVDHNHKTKQIRGLLCDSCNKLLGFSKENIDILNKAIKYLNKECEIKVKDYAEDSL